ncbi:MAG: hypothetical protein A2X86_14750 [Bdellovibrionales bacterium GWA2_49_15]|nr:MAG: hypothetical protein A2X86_14750 [Bdellovibrionales bacterium GWA2_49_15]HAZ13400.1 hypothetical protein [Bdellovibrionales bacterium]
MPSIALTLILTLLTFSSPNGVASGKNPEDYILKNVGAITVKTCKIEVSGKADCHPGTMGEAVQDSFRMGMTIMTVSGLKGSEDKRWDYVVYAVTDKICSAGGVSMGAMRTHPSIFRDTQKEFDGMITSKKISMEKSKIEGVDFYIGHLHAKDCLLAFGYPADNIILLVMAGKDEREKIAKAVKAMLTGTKL